MLSKAYDPKQTEAKHYTRWEEQGYFEPKGEGSENYTIMIPPPNVTGSLHVGHGLTMSLQDMLIRYNRMLGKNTLWQPGTDHAGIATQMVVERQLDAIGVKRQDLGRDKFLEKVWEWKAESGGTITSQLRRLGASCAWSREDFTMNPHYNKAVNKVFVDLYNKGLIYRGTRLVNWDPVLETAVSDLEVEHKESKGHIWHLKYPLSDGSGFVTVATTRPETVFGDTAVAVNPEDERYQSIIGKTVMLPLMEREIPVIADSYVDAEFGSGVVKITPAHDFNDFEVGKRHDLPQINVLTKQAKMNENVPADYVGLDRFVARKKLVEAFEALGLLEKIEEHTNNVGHGDRTGAVIEPFLTEQWYAKATELAKPALKAVQDGRTKFVPENWTKTYYNWMENIEDWCISRQLWWGHQIPAWYNENGEVYVGEEAPQGEGWTRDNDVLDTWFSSALWPFVTLGWPEKTAELKRHYPGNVLVTGHDIIFFWVARMMMMGIEFMGEVPFDTVYVHALVKDENGQKMSKSKGNVIDPLEIIEQYGTDAFRFTMASLAAPGRDVKLAVSKIEGYRNFCTKIWNAARYAEMNEVKFDASFDVKTANHPVNRWIVGEMSRLITSVDKGFADYRFNDIATSIYDFVWNTYCSWYLELSKPLVYGEDEALKTETQNVMGAVLEAMLRVMHPLMPYITEEIWQQLTGNEEASSIMMQEWPTTKQWTVDADVKADIDWLVSVVSAIRAARSENNVPPKAEVSALYKGAGAEDSRRMVSFAPFFKSLCNVISWDEMSREMGATDVATVAEGFEIILPLEGHVDFEAEKERVQKEIAKFEAELNKIQGMLKNENFVARAPESVVQENKARAEVLTADLSKLKAVLEMRG